MISRALLGVIGLFSTILSVILFRRGFEHSPTMGAAALLVIVAILGAIGFLVGPNIRRPILVNLFAFFAAIYAADIYVGVVFRPLETGSRFAGFHADWQIFADARDSSFGKDRRTAQQVIADFRQTGVDAVPIIQSGLFLDQPLSVAGAPTLPLGGISGTATVMCNEYGVWSIFKSDARGFNNPNELWGEKKIDLAVLGDSFTAGACVPSGENMVDRIRERVPATLNLGLGMSGPLFMLARLREYLAEMRPTNVIYVYYEGNDFQDLEREKQSNLLIKYLKPEFRQHLPTRQSDIDSALRAFVDKVLHESSASTDADISLAGRSTGKFLLDVLLIRDLRQFFGLYLVKEESRNPGCRRVSPFTTENIVLFRQILGEARDTVTAWGGHFFLAFLPEWQRYTAPDQWACYNARDAVLAAAKALAIPVIDMAEMIGTKKYPIERMWVSPSTHFGPQGYAAAAEMLMAALIQAGD